MTITLAAIYAPIGLRHNQIASIFRSFAFTLLVGALIISRLVVLTLSPIRGLPKVALSLHIREKINIRNGF
ncbi:hypothetical protein [Candidatus Coxiella mudrowiae]|uniref:hypothetical protein n=1 Tax=Candidatus Coxiella mudrowiae TaxID=2054173 RepID=UPI000C292252|nr:hypothetical protein [Candidatus Coxiella mudrowiae]